MSKKSRRLFLIRLFKKAPLFKKMYDAYLQPHISQIGSSSEMCSSENSPHFPNFFFYYTATAIMFGLFSFCFLFFSLDHWPPAVTGRSH